MRQFVVEYMRDLELLKIGRVQYDNPQLLSFMSPELQMDKETKLWFRSQNKARGETICSDGGKMIEIQLKFREEAENARKQENPFYKKLERYRFPRISIGENRDCQAIEIIPKLLSDMGYKNGDMEGCGAERIAPVQREVPEHRQHECYQVARPVLPVCKLRQQCERHDLYDPRRH